MERNLSPTQKAWIKNGYEHAKSIHQSLEEELNRFVSADELQEDPSIQETGELIYGSAVFPARSCFESDKDYNNADNDLDQDESCDLFNEGIETYLEELKAEESDSESSKDKEYYVNIDGEDVKVDVKSDSEYVCLLNCLEGYYIYGIGRDDEDETNEE